jgi:hypothetical protein
MAFHSDFPCSEPCLLSVRVARAGKDVCQAFCLKKKLIIWTHFTDEKTKISTFPKIPLPNRDGGQFSVFF